MTTGRQQAHAWQLPVAGAVALLLGIGLGRYVFTPLITPLIEQGWFSAEQTARLGAINLLGYLIGAAVANSLGRMLGLRRTIATALVVITISLFACMWNAGMLWYGLWRLLAGVAAATLTIMVTPAIMVRTRAAARPLASALIFTGIGIGTIASSLIVPWLAAAGIAVTWAAVGLVAAVLGAWSWWAVWRDLAPLGTDGAADGKDDDSNVPWLALGFILAAYGLNSMGYVPHSLYWVDYIARELGAGLATANRYWLLLGIGGVMGPAMAGVAARWIGFRPALVMAFALMTGAVTLPLLSSATWALAVSSWFVGAMVPAIITLTAGTVVELSPPARSQQIWGWVTFSFAITQAIGGFGMAELYALTGSYRATIAAGAVLLCLGWVCAALGSLVRSRSG